MFAGIAWASALSFTRGPGCILPPRAKFQGSPQIFFDRQPPSLVCIEHNALEVNAVAAFGLGEFAIHGPDLCQDLLSPIAARVAGRETETVRQEHRMTGHFL